ncbi:hypothetical protein [Fodinicola acaciae]|uniref:TPR repeat region-containing protein n=1 Tax=Fodinicola acaciae TaxID=2681555 RepID=UPI0013D12F96|nr:hypothetical protein [Fodinicola acaciae]
MAATPDIPDTQADPGTITAGAVQLNSVAATVTGHGGDVYAAISSAALSFSDIVSGPIKDLAGKNLADWESAFQGITYGASVTTYWSQNVQQFKNERNALVTEWEQALGNSFGVHQPYVPGGATQEQAQETINSYNQQVASAQNAKAADITNRAHQLLEKLRGWANDRASQIQRDPTESDLQQLAQAGALSWGAYVAFGKQTDPSIAPPVTPADGQRAAEIIKNGGTLAERDWARRVLGLVNAHAKYALAHPGQKLSGGELGFLRGLWGVLGKDLTLLGDRNGPQSFLPDLGDSLLALSNEKIGGGFDQLPPEIRSLVHDSAITSSDSQVAPDANVTTYSINREGEWKGLIALFAGSTIEGGKQFSTDLTYRVNEIAATYDRVHDTASGVTVNSSGLLDDRGQLVDGLQYVLNTSTRNHDANYDIITGKQGHEIITRLTNYNWNDDGAAASGLVNWIATDAQAPHDSDTWKHARDAALVVIDTAGDDKSYQTFIDGTTNNPHLARAYADVAGSYLSDFSEKSPDGDSRVEGDGSLALSTQDRARFLGLVATDKTALTGLAVKVGNYDAQLLDEYRGADPTRKAELVERISILDGQVAAAPAQLNAHNDAKAALDYRETLYYIGAGKSLAQTLAGTLPGVGSIASLTVGQITDHLVQYNFPPPTGHQLDLNNPFNQQGGQEVTAAYDYASSLVRSGHVPPELAPFVTDGHLVSRDALADPSVKQNLVNAVRQAGGSPYIDTYAAKAYDAYQKASQVKI